jgi:hypothetical protein
LYQAAAAEKLKNLMEIWAVIRAKPKSEPKPELDSNSASFLGLAASYLGILSLAARPRNEAEEKTHHTFLTFSWRYGASSIASGCTIWVAKISSSARYKLD